jgi:hypothetical protein
LCTNKVPGRFFGQSDKVSFRPTANKGRGWEQPIPRLDEEFERRWHQEAEAEHPKATFREIEAAVDEKLNGMRARLLEDLALASRAVWLNQIDHPAQGRRPVGICESVNGVAGAFGVVDGGG